jgi:hypothetical protein
VNIRNENLVSHLHWGQEGHEGDDVACKAKKRAPRSAGCKSWQRAQSGIRCDEVTRYILGLSCLLFVSKDWRGFIFVFFARRARVMVHYDINAATQ